MTSPWLSNHYAGELSPSRRRRSHSGLSGSHDLPLSLVVDGRGYTTLYCVHPAPLCAAPLLGILGKGIMQFVSRLGAVAAICVALALLTFVLFRPVHRGSAGLAPNFQLIDTRGQPQELAANHGRPVLINFFATWCAPCRAELPLIAHAQTRDPRLAVLLIDEQESASVVRTFLNGLHVRIPALLDTAGRVAQRYRVTGQPVSFWIAPSGRVRYVSRGAMDAWIISTRLHDLMAPARPSS